MVRIGILIPPANTTCEVEYPLATMGEIDCVFHFSRLNRKDKSLNVKSLVEMKYSAADAAELLAVIPVSLIGYACTSGSFLSGSERHDEISDAIEDKLKIPAVTTSTAVVKSLRALEAKRIGVITPYPIEIANSTVEFLKSFGFDVVDFYTFNYHLSKDVRELSGELISEKVHAMSHNPEVDAIFISCTNVSTFTLIKCLETQTGIPIVSSNSATLWLMLRQLELCNSVSMIGRLGECQLGKS